MLPLLPPPNQPQNFRSGKGGERLPYGGVRRHETWAHSDVPVTVSGQVPKLGSEPCSLGPSRLLPSPGLAFPSPLSSIIPAVSPCLSLPAPPPAPSLSHSVLGVSWAGPAQGDQGAGLELEGLKSALTHSFTLGDLSPSGPCARFCGGRAEPHFCN